MGDRNRWFSWRNILLFLLTFQLVCLWGFWIFGPKPVELAFIIPDTEQKPWQSVSRSFERSHPGIRIKLVSNPTTTDTPDERAASYKADFGSPEPQHDLVYMDITWTAEFAEYLVDLGDLVQQDDVSLDGFLDSELQAGKYQGHLYRMPMRADIGLLFYRKDLLDQIGVSLPRKLKLIDLLRIVQSLDEKANVGYLWQGNRDEGLVANFVEVLDTMGGTWIDSSQNKPMLNTEEVISAAKILQQLIQDGISPNVTQYKGDKALLEEFLKGKTLFLRGWPAFYQQISNRGLAEKVEIVPPFSFGSKMGGGCRGGWGFGILKNSVHRKEAWEAIQYFTSAEGQKKFVLASGYLPTRTALFEDEDIDTKYPKMRQISKYLKEASVFRPALEQYTEVSEILQEALSDILQGKEPRETMEEAQNKTQKLLDSN